MKTKWFLRAFALFAGISFAACGDKEIIPVFPDSAEHTMAAGETKELTFVANTTWSLTTDKTWCVFVEEDGEESMQKTGKAGTITITVKVKDIDQDFNNSRIVNLDLKMAGASQAQTIFEITRPKDVRRVTMFKRESGVYNSTPELELEYQLGKTASLEIGFTANFDWKVLSKTDGIILSSNLSGEANTTTTEAEFKTSYISLDSDKISASFSGEIVISDLNGENTFTFPVTYDGMGDTDLFFSELYLRASSDASVSFSNKGFLMSREASPKPTEETAFSFTATTAGMQSTGFVVTLNDSNEPEIAADTWLILTSEGDGNYTIEVDGRINLGEARDAYVIVLPEALAGTPDFTPYFADGQPKGSYIFKVSQAAAPSGAGLFIAWNGGLSPIPDEKLIPWLEHSFSGEEGRKENPADFGIHGLAVENAYVYEFSKDDIDGDLVVMPTGVSVSGNHCYPMGTNLSGTRQNSTYMDSYCLIFNGITDFSYNHNQDKDDKTPNPKYHLVVPTFNNGNQYAPSVGVVLYQAAGNL